MSDRRPYDKTYEDLFSWCESEGFSGYDPFDGLNSSYFQALPLKHFAPLRLAFLQLVKRSGAGLRTALRVGKGVNPKGIALFALSELSRFRATGGAAHSDNAKEFLDQLLGMKLPLPDGKCAWGYNFDWQSRAFFAPRGTPTIVPTAFATKALLEAHREFGDERYIQTAREVCAVIEQDLNRSEETEDEICFSYTTIDRSVIYNASLLAAECLAEVGAIDGDSRRRELASKALRFVVRRQRKDGAWTYGPRLRHGWVDNFHTAYILLSMKRISDQVPELKDEVNASFKLGMEFWLGNLFLDDGTPKYYDSDTYPVDIHSAAAAIVALSELSSADDGCLPQARKVLDWTIANMRDGEGYFYYRMTKDGVIKTPFMRWGEAWMAYALAKFIEANGEIRNWEFGIGNS